MPALGISLVMGLPSPSVQGLALVQAAPLPHAVGVEGAQVEPREELEQEEERVAPDQEPQRDALLQVALGPGLVMAAALDGAVAVALGLEGLAVVDRRRGHAGSPGLLSAEPTGTGSRAGSAVGAAGSGSP